MKIDLFTITFNRSDGVFLVGDRLEGQVILNVNSPIFVNALNLTIEGKAKSKWEVHKNDSNKSYKAYQTYLDECKPLLSGGSNAYIKLEAGSYTYPFSMTLPTDIPSSFEGRKGYIRYSCRACIERKYKELEDVEKTFTVIHPLDLNTIPSAKEPAIVQKEEMIESCCCEEGLVFLQLKIDKSGFVPGENIQFTIECHNNTTSDLYNIVLELHQNVTYTGYNDSLFSSGQPKYHTKTTPITLYESSDGIARQKYVSIKKLAVLPAMPPSKLDGCDIITTEYELFLSIASGFQSISCSMFITIGTVPIRIPITYGPIIRRAPSPTNQSPIVSHNDITANVTDAPPSYEECVFGRLARVTNESSPSHSTPDWTPSYPMLSSPNITDHHPVTVQPS